MILPSTIFTLKVSKGLFTSTISLFLGEPRFAGPWKRAWRLASTFEALARAATGRFPLPAPTIVAMGCTDFDSGGLGAAVKKKKRKEEKLL